MIRVGTSGYSYEDWKGPFYPPKARKQDDLRHYADHFDTCKINFSYYRIFNNHFEAKTVSGAKRLRGALGVQLRFSVSPAYPCD